MFNNLILLMLLEEVGFCDLSFDEDNDYIQHCPIEYEKELVSHVFV